jgi:DNA-binding transcriptional ArsR family regulator
MHKKLLVIKENQQFKAKDIAIFNEPHQLKMTLGKLSWKILTMLSEKEMYPMEIAKNLGIHEQKVYYHIRKLQKAHVIKIVKEEEKKGAKAKYYKAIYPALGIELPSNYAKISLSIEWSLDEKLRQFLTPILQEDGTFNGKIVVGSPDPHGPFKTTARDGHYTSYLTFFLGQLAKLPEDFIIKLDVDIKAEKEETNNLIVVGGPGTNLIAQEINQNLPIRFNMTQSDHGFLFGGLLSENSGRLYTLDTIGLVAKIVNPWDHTKRIILLAGNKAVGTKACVLAITRFWKETLKNFNGTEPFATVIQGFDLNGDGKVDSIEVLE